LRLFLAGPLPEQLESTLLARLAPLRRAAPQVRWVHPGQLHFTLAFLGEVPETSVASVVERLGPVAARHPALALAVRGAGCFGRPRRPTVLFAEVGGDRAGLASLADDVRAALAPELGTGGDADRPFHPHLTVARTRLRQGDATLARCRAVLEDLDLGPFPLRHLVLFESQLRSGGAVHTEVAQFALGGPRST